MRGAEEKLMRPAYEQQKSKICKWFGAMKGLRSYTPLAALILLLIFIFSTDGWIHLETNRHSFRLQLTRTIAHATPLNCAAWNHTRTCSRNHTRTQAPDSSAAAPICPEYFRWIHEDLRHWNATGISKEMVDKAAATAHFRLIIVDGNIYVEKFRESIQTRALITIWGIVQLSRRYPGKLPDLDLMFDCDDQPVIPAKKFPPGSGPPLFRYCSDWRSLDIVFPDWSFWGWAEINIEPWKLVLEEMKKGNERTKWEDRVPYAYWKGNPHVCPWRGDLMKCNATPEHDWNARLYVQDWLQESRIGFMGSNLDDQCTHRYKIYIEGWGWSVSEKYILACNSPTLLITPRWHDFFIRGMAPQRHYWPIRGEDKCRSLKFAVEWGNNHTQKAKGIGEAGSRFVHEELRMEYVYDYMYHLLNEYAKLLKYKPIIPPKAVEVCAESLACSADGTQRKFMEESMEIYASDLFPCEMPLPFNPRERKALRNKRSKATKQVEEWESRYWETLNSTL